MSEQLAPHFTREEFDAKSSGGKVPSIYDANLRAVAALLERVRAIGGGFPLEITSYWRDPDHNRAVGGVSNSAHLTGAGVDFMPIGTTPAELTRKLFAAEAAGTAPAYGQWIIYADGHVHVSLPRASEENGEKLEAEGPASSRIYRRILSAEQFLTTHAGASIQGALLLFIVGAFLFWWARHPMGPL